MDANQIHSQFSGVGAWRSLHCWRRTADRLRTVEVQGGRHTVRPDCPATTLVIAGPYSITRNPMYLGLAFAYLGISIVGESVWALILLPAVLIVIQRWAIAPEETFLQRRFGDAYTRYTTQVRRWM